VDAGALREAGIAPGLLRCSVGLEDAEDLRADFGWPGRRSGSADRQGLTGDTPH